MDIIELTADNAESYSELIDRNTAECLCRTGYLGAAAVDEGHPLAAMIWLITDDHSEDNTAEIVWMDVKDDDAAKELLKTYNRSIEDAGVTSSSFAFDKVLFKTPIKVLGDAGFSLTEGEGADVFTTIADLINSPLTRIKGNCDSIYELNTLKKRAFDESIRDCLSKTKRDVSSDLATLGMGWFEPEVSCYSEKECILNGMLLVHKMPEGALQVELLSIWGPAEEALPALMIKYAISKASELYPANTQVMIHRRDEMSMRLCAYCLPKAKGRPSIYGKRQET